MSAESGSFPSRIDHVCRQTTATGRSQIAIGCKPDFAVAATDHRFRGDELSASWK